ncbi:hypothetical protein EHI44_18595 [Rhizobium leguminosarum]|uniref:hypothetical protein n=1 Tax=Rhizobium leguminosarum TaxID=384 RepID=UPI00027D7ED0|nr:hypothetical protein [Rhizobium leguminosarum]RWY84660.1 hypothetical protein EHI44_18595 [Rhizobium leguminosarum]
MRDHWNNCVTHFDQAVDEFVGQHFADTDTRCLLIAGAGFDPRARRIAEKLAAVMGERLRAFFIREERGDPSADLKSKADENEAALRALVVNSSVNTIRIFAEDGAPVAGQRLIEALREFVWPDDTTDIVLDLSALSLGIAFPAAKFVLDNFESSARLNFHLMVSSNPELDAKILGEPSPQAISVRGFPDPTAEFAERPVARIWLPHLAHGSASKLQKIRALYPEVYKVCPLVPFPARNPRRADELLTEYLPQLVDEWDVDPRDLIYVSERNPLDSYRTITTLKERYDRSVKGIYQPQLILSPLGSKVMAAGAMMAAIQHELPVQYVETLRYDYDPGSHEPTSEYLEMTVHVWLHGPIYAGFRSGAPSGEIVKGDLPAPAISEKEQAT